MNVTAHQDVCIHAKTITAVDNVSGGGLENKSAGSTHRLTEMIKQSTHTDASDGGAFREG